VKRKEDTTPLADLIMAAPPAPGHSEQIHGEQSESIYVLKGEPLLTPGAVHESIHRPYTGHTQAIHRPYTGHTRAIHGPYTGHTQARYPSYPKAPAYPLKSGARHSRDTGNTHAYRT